MKRICVFVVFLFLMIPTSKASSQAWEYAKLYINEQTGHSFWDGQGAFTANTRVELWQKLGLHDPKNPRMISTNEILNHFGKKGWELIDTQESRSGSIYQFKRRVGRK
ncbi:MAG: hypothetical protein WAW41_09875 [Methylobacter sp.]